MLRESEIHTLYTPYALLSFLKCVIPAGCALLAATVFMDSVFWNRWLWPEGEVLWYNTMLNRSSDYGVRIRSVAIAVSAPSLSTMYMSFP